MISLAIFGPVIGVFLTTAIGGVVWAFKLDGKVNTQNAVIKAQRELNDRGIADLKEFMGARFDGLDTRLERIERNGNGKAKV